MLLPSTPWPVEPRESALLDLNYCLSFSLRFLSILIKRMAEMREINMTIHNSFAVNFPVRMSMIVSTIRKTSKMSHPIPYFIGCAGFIELPPFLQDIKDKAPLACGTQQNMYLLEKVMEQKDRLLPDYLHWPVET